MCKPIKNIRKFEYLIEERTICSKKSEIDFLNEKGEESWELVNILLIKDGHIAYYHFKREKK